MDRLSPIDRTEHLDSGDTHTSCAPTPGNTLAAHGVLDPSVEYTDLQLASGRIVRLPTSLLLDGTPHATQNEGGSQAAQNPAPADTAPNPAQLETAPGESAEAFTPPGSTVIPIVEERLDIGKRTVETSRILLEKHVHEYHETLDVPLALRTFDIERVVLNQPVETAPAIRHEGDTTIYPIVEEQLVLTTQLILREELRVTQRDAERRDNRTVTVHRESITVTRTPLTPDALHTPDPSHQP